MLDSFFGVLTRILMWGAAAVFTTSILIAGTFAVAVGGVWMLLTGRNPLLLYRSYSDMANRFRGGNFGWSSMPQGGGFGSASADANAEEAPAPRKAPARRRFGRSSDVQDAVVKEIRS
ncbi:MAG: hypothetical protein QMB72_03960 [Brachymonas denitrificans]|jgi:hypothetical protein|uniref:hypothetical protein n=1 Tax=Brachymonas denitrificans TaxID=28220 RepID=UPI001BD10456|nr:hypothetical protein [Brachymonas denitrificans]